MKRIVLPSILILAALLVCCPAFGQDEGGSSAMVVFRPSVSVGYVGNIGDLDYNMYTHTFGIGMTTMYDFTYRCYSSLYLDAGLAAGIGDRLAIEASVRWAPPGNTFHMRENVIIGGGLYGRSWKATTSWLAVDGNISYAVVKDVSIIKSFAPKVGVRWDRWDIDGTHPYDVTSGWAVPSPTDTMDSYVSILMPYAGFSLVLGGLQWGMFGGDLEIDAIGGPLAWGDVHHKAYYNLGIYRRLTMEGSLDRGYFYEVSLDYNVLTLDFSPKVTGTVGLFGRIAGYNAQGTLDAVRVYAPGVQDGPLPYKFDLDRTVYATGITLAVTFDIYGRPDVIPAPAPAPVIEPKLEPMSKN
ncbi:MAG: hypothetical protein JW765_08510 [Deltaproteobacteria bacterium]|nr:hypothetical protein [Candidatus Zymogenaceae bacterium]